LLTRDKYGILPHADVEAVIISIQPVSAHGIQIAYAGRLASSIGAKGKYETEISARYLRDDRRIVDHGRRWLQQRLD
jgi:hypothetical protein